MNETIGERIAKTLWMELRRRSGFDAEVDDDTEDEILDEWNSIIRTELIHWVDQG